MSHIEMNHLNEKHNAEGIDPLLHEGFSKIMEYLGRNNDLTESEKANFADTAVRAAKAFAGLTATRTQIAAEIRDILQTGFPVEGGARDDRSGMITQGPIQVFSYCPHHLLPVEYQVYVSYITGADGKVLGLSKLARIAKALGKRPVLQEQLAHDIADVLHAGGEAVPDATPEQIDAGNFVRFPAIKSAGSAVLLTGKHSCMTCRGVQSDALTSVAELRGSFWKEGQEDKFYQAVGAINSSSLRGG